MRARLVLFMLLAGTIAVVSTAPAGALAVPPRLPPAAPAPTSDGNSPAAPDPHPPAGGIGPRGEAVGGPLLQSRGLVTPAGSPALPANLTASAWVLVDLDSGAVLAARDPHGRYQPASILKVLTVDTLLPKLPGERIVTVSATAAGTEGSKAGLIAGGSYTVDQLFSGLLLVSGNDTAMALAEAAGGVAQTVQAMNAKALAMGAYDTFVQTPSGLDGWQQLTSAYDMALFLRAAVANPRFVAYDERPTVTLPAQHVGAVLTPAVTLINQGATYFKDVPGGFIAKTGYTNAAVHTYLAAASRGGRRLGVAFLRAQRWPIDQWQQAAELFGWGFALPAATLAVGQLPAAVANPSASPSLALKADRNPRPAAGGHHVGWVALATLGSLLLVVALAVGIADRRYRARGRSTARRR